MDPEGVRHPSSVREIDWSTWRPGEKATLLFVLSDGHILLIDKKTGLGAGKVNGPGGRIEPGETALQGAIREVQEELCVTPTGVREAGELYFQFVDGYSLHGTVFTATGFDGELCETREAAPRWTPLDEDSLRSDVGRRRAVAPPPPPAASASEGISSSTAT